jgi:predicted kinase
MIILMAGLPGTGKSTLARELARRMNGHILGKDEIRAAIFAPPNSPQDEIEFSTEQDDFVMEVMLQSARFLLKRRPDRVIYLDGRPFSRRYQIERVLSFAAEINQSARIIECVCSEESARRRLEDERDPDHPAKNRSFTLYLEVKAGFEPITHPKTVISTDQPLERCIDPALASLEL